MSRHGLKVRRVDAGTVSAKVVELESVGDWADQQLVGEAMPALTAPAGVLESPVAFREPGSPDLAWS